MEENKELVSIIIAVGAGIFTILASILDWDFFFNNRKTKFFVSILGRNGARIFYSILGLGFFFFAYKMLTN